MMDSLTIAKMDMKDIMICLVGYMSVFIILSVHCVVKKYFQVKKIDKVYVSKDKYSKNDKYRKVTFNSKHQINNSF